MVSGMSSNPLFSRFGIELEYMIVDERTHSVLPIADRLLSGAAALEQSCATALKQCSSPQNPPLLESSGTPTPICDVERGEASWSNELALHLIEIKTNEPVPRFEGIAGMFDAQVRQINSLLGPQGGRLMPTAMHPWMDPRRETQLWPHDNCEIYQAFHRIFDCRGHGWSNMQSIHLNLPFEGDDEFGRLHAAIRLVLPILPVLAASSPIVEGRPTGLFDNRVAFYRTNCSKLPSLTGRVVPEPVFTTAEYKSQILQRIYRDLAAYDPHGFLQHEWANARGAIARFERDTIEIRLLDMQECPQADVAICAAVVGVLEALVSERWSSSISQQSWSVEPLESILLATMVDADGALIEHRDYLDAFGMPAERCTAGELWSHLVECLSEPRTPVRGPAHHLRGGFGHAALRTIMNEGPLARRIMRALGENPSHEQIEHFYQQLCDCLARGVMFKPS